MHLESDNGTSFKGFMIQARVLADDSPVGYFTNYSADYQLQCGNDVSVHITNTSLQKYHV